VQDQPPTLILTLVGQIKFGEPWSSFARDASRGMLREGCFVSVFALHVMSQKRNRDESKTSTQDSERRLYSVSLPGSVWDGGGVDEIATFVGPNDACFRRMDLVDSIDGHQLLTAARRNKNDVIVELIKRGANVDGINYTSRDNKTALAIAADADHVETVSFLSTKDYVSLDYGVDNKKLTIHCALRAITNHEDEVNWYTVNMTYLPAFPPFGHEMEVVGRFRDTKRLSSEEETSSLDDSNKFDRLFRQLVRTMEVVEMLLEAGARPTEGLINPLHTKNPLEMFAKQLLCNPMSCKILPRDDWECLDPARMPFRYAARPIHLPGGILSR
jgi:hypothetical protein